MTGFDGMWLPSDQDPRMSETETRGEKACLASYLEHYRETLRLKCEGLSPEQLARRSVPPSTLSLLGLVRHLARVEHHWFRRVLDGAFDDLPRLYSDDGDVPFDEAVGTEECLREAWAAWEREVAFGRAWYAACDDLGAEVTWGEERAEVRDVMVHLIEEYARHAGHADLLRECIDGRTGS